MRAVKRHEVPAWWRDAKLGIFVHWTPASVPGFAPTGEEVGALMHGGRRDALAWSPYTEWYENSLRFPGSPAARHHAATYGDRPYRSFAHDWEAALASWDPDEWARRFAAAGARYVVLVTKHHDGYCLWPSDVANPNAPEFRCSRDVVGELAEAVRAAGLRFGVYYSGGLDWTWNDHPIGTVTDLAVAAPRGGYVEYAEAQVRELVARYRPSVLWNDISWPGTTRILARLLADYYRAVPDGVANDRFLPWSAAWHLVRSAPVRRLVDAGIARSAGRDRGIIPPKPPLFDVRTPEYTVFDGIQHTPWECVRGIDKSFGYNRMSTGADFIGERELTWMLVDIAAKNGNLLLNVGPRGEDATIPCEQLDRLAWLASFTSAAGEALYATRPWVVPSGATPDASEVRYTARDRDVYTFVRTPAASVVLRELAASPTTEVRRVDRGTVAWQATGEGVRIVLDPPPGPDAPAIVAVRDARARGTGADRSD